MEAKHTQGPWSRSNPRGLTINGPPDRTGWVLTVAHVADRPDEKQALADACLIAAAPDLLAALEDIVQVALEDIVQASDANDGDSLMHAIQAAQTIIAKAKGEVR
jgi:hypothetical protein